MSNSFLLYSVFIFLSFIHADETSGVNAVRISGIDYYTNKQYDILRNKRDTTVSHEFGSQKQRLCFYNILKKCFDGAFINHISCINNLVYSKFAKHYWDQAIYHSYTPNFNENFINCTTSKIKTIIEPDTPGIFTSLNKLKDKPSPRLGSGMKLKHQECVEYWTWKCLTDQQTLNCYMNMRYSEMAEIINSCSNLAYNKLGVPLDTFEDVQIPPES